MLFLGKPVHEINLTDVERFRDTDKSEDRYLDYKQQLPVKDDKKAIERFLFGVAAMANGGGGLLLYGIKERQESGKNTGLIEEILGVSLEKTTFDSEKQRLNELLHDHIDPAVPGVDIFPIDTRKKEPLIAISVPRSFAAPHMVTKDKLNIFYSRNSAGKYRMDVHEIRSQFLGNADALRQVEEWVKERQRRIMADDMVFALGSTNWVSMHIVPLGSLTGRFNIDPKEISKLKHCFVPLGSGSQESRFSFEGFTTFATNRNIARGARAFTNVFRTGQVEIVSNGSAVFMQTDKGNRIFTVKFEQDLACSFANALTALQTLGVELPILVSISIKGVMGGQFLIPVKHKWEDLVEMVKGGILGNDLDFAPFWIEDWVMVENPHKTLKPIFDALWNAAGWDGSPNFDEAGEWKPSV